MALTLILRGSQVAKCLPDEWPTRGIDFIIAVARWATRALLVVVFICLSHQMKKGRSRGECRSLLVTEMITFYLSLS